MNEANHPEKSAVQTLFAANFETCKQRIEKLAASLAKVQSLLPLDLDALQRITPEQEESIDALILRYSQCVSIIQDHLFRGIAWIEQEDISDKSNRDKARLMEKIGAIASAEAFGTATLLRNKFSHHYPEEPVVRLERLNLILQQAAAVIQVFHEIAAFARLKNYLAVAR